MSTQRPILDRHHWIGLAVVEAAGGDGHIVAMQMNLEGTPALGVGAPWEPVMWYQFIAVLDEQTAGDDEKVFETLAKMKDKELVKVGLHLYKFSWPEEAKSNR